jgi:hypothetical protein
MSAPLCICWPVRLLVEVATICTPEKIKNQYPTPIYAKNLAYLARHEVTNILMIQTALAAQARAVPRAFFPLV